MKYMPDQEKRDIMTKLELTPEWDKVFPQSNKVDHRKITFHNRFGTELAADLYKPKGATGKLPAIAISGPFGAVKEQSSGLYAQTLAERGFLTIAFDPTSTGESGGSPRYYATPDQCAEDFMASVDYLVTSDEVDPDRVGILGICGWGGMAVNAASYDPRIKATVASTMYDMHRVTANGYFDADDSAKSRNERRAQLAEIRTKEYKDENYERAGGVVDPLPDDAPQFVKDYHAYYKTPRGYHARSLNSNDGWTATTAITLTNAPIMAYAKEIENPVMLVHGDTAHSFYFSEATYKVLEGGIKPENKEFVVIPGATHTDLYDQIDIIPWDKIQEFYEKSFA